MSLSLITFNRGRDRHLERLLEGAARGHRVPDETIVVSLGEEQHAAYPGVKSVNLLEGGLALARSRNVGRTQARGDILVFLDVDCIPSHYLLGAIETAAAETDALVCGKVMYLTQPVPSGWTDAELRREGHLHPARPFVEDAVVPAPNPGLFWSLAFGVQASTYDQLGGFDEGFTGYGGEDTDFAFRAAAAGIPILLQGSGCAFHQRHDAHDPPLAHCADIVRNARRFHARHGFWPMRGWLDAFAALGLVTIEDGELTLHRLPTETEIVAHRVPSARAF